MRRKPIYTVIKKKNFLGMIENCKGEFFLKKLMTIRKIQKLKMSKNANEACYIDKTEAPCKKR